MSDPTEEQLAEWAERTECAHDANSADPMCKCPCHERASAGRGPGIEPGSQPLSPPGRAPAATDRSLDRTLDMSGPVAKTGADLNRMSRPLMISDAIALHLVTLDAQHRMAKVRQVGIPRPDDDGKP